MASVETALITCALLLIFKKKKKKNYRRFWVHPFTSERRLCGHYTTTFRKLIGHEKKFANCYRMSYSSFQELLEILKPELTRQNTVLRSCISAEERLLITIR